LLISTEQTEANGVLVAVRDSGPGIDPEHVARVFEAFYTTKSSGVGMGLAICRSIIDAHGLWAEAYEPPGAVFQFTLPGVESWVPAGRMAAIRPPPTSCGRSAGHDAELSKRQKSGSWAEDRLLPRACGPIA
jgi:hypothetical protein